MASLTLVSFCGRFPVFRTNDWQTHLTLFIDVRMVDFCLERDLWRFERVFRGEGELNPKRSLFIRSTVLGTTKTYEGKLETSKVFDGFV